jgi:hypothetical protein
MYDTKVELDVCESEMDRLSPWECSFIESVRDQFNRGRDLSEKQLDKLHLIYEKVV